MINDNYGNFGPPSGHQMSYQFSCIDGDISDGYTITVVFHDIVDNRIGHYTVQAICLMKIFDGNKTANRLRQQGYDLEQQDGHMTPPRPACVKPPEYFSEMVKEWRMHP